MFARFIQQLQPPLDVDGSIQGWLCGGARNFRNDHLQPEDMTAFQCGEKWRGSFDEIGDTGQGVRGCVGIDIDEIQVLIHRFREGCFEK